MSDLEALRRLVRGGVAALERSRQRIDDLNVYPVPDGDTGTNLLLTVRGIEEALGQPEAEDRRALARGATRAALLSARGNSGVILSQIVRGAAEELGGADRIDAPATARALRGASNAAYAAVREPVEGTMLTVMGVLAEEAELRATEAEDAVGLLEDLIPAGEAAVARTKEQLDVLRRADVVDAGAAGLIELLRGVAAAAGGEDLPEIAAALDLPAQAVHQELSRYRYCTTFVIEGEDLDGDELERQLERLGDSLLVVGDRSALKAHVHTDDPDAALALGTAIGTVEAVEIADMHRQTEEREARLTADEPRASAAAVAVVAGEGNAHLFASLGAAHIVEGGQTMNPPASELLAAVEAANADEVVLLPNNANVILAAEQAAGLATRPVQVVPTRSLQAGLAALIAFHPERTAEENAAEMREAVLAAATGEVTTASRDAELDGLNVHEGEFLGLLDGRAVATGASFAEVAAAVAQGLLAKPREVLTLLAGDGAPELNGFLDELRERHPEVEIDLHDGGQPHYQLLLLAE
ncbi:MAG TPA: DAK2 domain-containing protein [Gaiellaceae bacterium]|nr:DAK2 domain-containing protein [Gaiellaceae bacterium]